jgi:multicomponent Na+:H+ antiporter subunit F
MSEYREYLWQLVITIVALSMLITLSLAFLRARLGPTVFDRILALNMFGTKTVLLICVIGVWTDRTDFLDLALLFSLMNFIGMVAVLRFTTVGNFGGERLQ